MRGMTVAVAVVAACATVVMVAIHAIYLQIDVSRLYNNNNNILQATCCCHFFLKGMAVVATVVVVAVVHVIYLKIVVSRLYKNKNKILQGLEMHLEPLLSFFLRGMTITVAIVAACVTVVMVDIHTIHLQIDVSRLYKNKDKNTPGGSSPVIVVFFKG